MAQEFLDDLKRQRCLMLPNLAPETFRKKYDPSFKIRVEIFTLKHKETVRQHQKISELKGVKAMKKMVNSTFGLSKGGKKIQARRTEALANAKLDRPSSTTFLLRESVGKPIPFNPKDKFGPALFDRGCLTCGKDNLFTKYHGDRHVCINCRNQIKTYDGDEVKIYLDQYGDIICKGVKFVEDDNAMKVKHFFDVPLDQIKVFEYRCFATYSGRDELIVLLHHDQTMRRQKDVKSRQSMTSSPIGSTPITTPFTQTPAVMSPLISPSASSQKIIKFDLATHSMTSIHVPLKSKFGSNK
jgi:hypothetical protein